MSDLESLPSDPMHPDLTLEPGGFGEAIVLALGEDSRALAATLEQTLFAAQGSGRLYDEIESLNEKLDKTNELLNNLIKVLSSRS
jgi:hypothetical protein